MVQDKYLILLYPGKLGNARFNGYWFKITSLVILVGNQLPLFLFLT